MLNRGNLSNLGSHVYGVAAIAFGVIGLIWRDFETVWQPIQALPFAVPHRTAIACLFAVCILIGGLAIQWPRAARIGAVTLGILYLICALFWLPRVIGFPKVVGTWLGFAEQSVLVLAAVIVYASLEPSDSAWGTKAIQVARILFGICFLVIGLSHFVYVPQTAAMVPKWIPPGQNFWAITTGIAHVCAGLAILSGVLAALASRLLTAMILGFGLLVWLPTLIATPRDHTAWGGNAVNLAIAGAAWIVADSFTREQKEAATP
jgi:uncharacterized membrane protein YphA (DoxX/SURF4 family)